MHHALLFISLINKDIRILILETQTIYFVNIYIDIVLFKTYTMTETNFLLLQIKVNKIKINKVFTFEHPSNS